MLSPTDAGILDKLGRPGAATHLLAAGDGRAIYRIGFDCYGVGDLGTPEMFGAVSCSDGFPSEDHPVLDFTVVHGQFDGAGNIAELSVWRSEGVAADGVAAVAFGDSAGEVVGSTPVRNNVYRHTTVPKGQFIALIALDAAGNVISAKPLAPQG